MAEKIVELLIPQSHEDIELLPLRFDFLIMFICLVNHP